MDQWSSQVKLMIMTWYQKVRNQKFLKHKFTFYLKLFTSSFLLRTKKLSASLRTTKPRYFSQTPVNQLIKNACCIASFHHASERPENLQTTANVIRNAHEMIMTRIERKNLGWKRNLINNIYAEVTMWDAYQIMKLPFCKWSWNMNTA